MVKTPRTRHSKASREPVTIDLEAEAVERNADEAVAVKAEEAASAEGETGAADREGARTADTAPEEPVNTGETETAGATQATPEGEAPSEPQREEPTRPRRAGVAALAVIAGLVGGAAGAGGVWFVERYSPENTAPDPALESLRQQVQALDSALARLLEERASAQASNPPADQALAPAVDELRQRVTAMESQIVGLNESVKALQEVPRLAPGAAALVPIEQRLTDVEDRLADLAQIAGQAEGSAELSGRLAAAEERITGSEQAAQEARQSATANAQRLDEIISRLTALEERVERQDEGPRLALIVAASALRSAVERGEPFAGELETYTALAPNPAAVEPLTRYADTGVPTDAELVAAASDAASRIVSATTALPPDAGFLDRLMASARSAVKVRPVGEVEGETPEAIAARMEAAVQRGDHAAAIAEYDSLPAAAKEAASDFAEKLRARIAAEEVLENALSDALNPA